MCLAELHLFLGPSSSPQFTSPPQTHPMTVQGSFPFLLSTSPRAFPRAAREGPLINYSCQTAMPYAKSRTGHQAPLRKLFQAHTARVFFPDTISQSLVAPVLCCVAAIMLGWGLCIPAPLWDATPSHLLNPPVQGTHSPPPEP